MPEEKGQGEQEERERGKDGGLEKERERNVVVLSLLSQALKSFSKSFLAEKSSFPD